MKILGAVSGVVSKYVDKRRLAFIDLPTGADQSSNEIGHFRVADRIPLPP